MFKVEYNGKSNAELNIFATRPEIPAPQFGTNEYKIPGRNGALIVRDGTVGDIEITVRFGFRCKQEHWNDKFNAAKGWLLYKGNGILRFQDAPKYFYKVKSVSIGNGEREVKEIGEFEAAFICEGFQYLMEGTKEYSIGEVRFNAYHTAAPVYKIAGEGVCNLIVNGKTMRVNAGQNITVDTERMIAYREDGNIMNTSVYGDYEDLYLLSGENTITITDGFEMKVIPNWRCV